MSSALLQRIAEELGEIRIETPSGVVSLEKLRVTSKGHLKFTFADGQTRLIRNAAPWLNDSLLVRAHGIIRSLKERNLLEGIWTFFKIAALVVLIIIILIVVLIVLGIRALIRLGDPPADERSSAVIWK